MVACCEFVETSMQLNFSDQDRVTKGRQWASKFREFGTLLVEQGMASRLDHVTAITQPRMHALDILKHATSADANSWQYLCLDLSQLLGFDAWNFANVRDAVRDIH